MTVSEIVQSLWSGLTGPRDYAALTREEREAISRDTAVAGEVLDRMAARGTGASRELPEMLQAVGLEPDVIARSNREAMRDMQITCSSCAAKAPCRRDLAHGDAAERYERYCPNAPTIAMLRSGAPGA